MMYFMKTLGFEELQPIHNQLQYETTVEMYKCLCNQVPEQVRNQVWDQPSFRLYTQLCILVRRQVSGQVWIQTQSN